MMPKNSVILILLFFFNGIIAQQDSLTSPLGIPLYLSGTFGELRSNHFHSGLDIKTNGEEGLPVFSVDDGYVYRIKIRHNGYGKAIYIKHPSGLVSVYGHLKKFNDRIESYIKQKQYEKQNFEIEVFPYPIELPVIKGETIAYSGNTGGSSGAHLHFELRNIKEHPLNPMAYGIRIDDHIPPVLKSLFVYPLGTRSQVNQSVERTKLNFNKINDSTFSTDTIMAWGELGFGIVAYDFQDNSLNRNGLYKITVLFNGIPIFQQVMEEFSFAHSHFINTVIDYPYYERYRRRIQKLWVEPYNPLEIYTHLINDGIIEINRKKYYQVEIQLSDFDNNVTYIKIPLFGYQPGYFKTKPKDTAAYYIPFNDKKVFSFDNWKVIFPQKTGYTGFYLDILEKSGKLKLIKKGVPLRNSIQLKYPLSLIDAPKRKYAYIARLSGKKKKYYVYGKQKNDTLTAYTKRFGTYTIAFDSIPPVIVPVNFKPKTDLTDYRYLKFYIADKQTGIKSYNGYIDDQWILFEYDYKTGSLIYDFSDRKLTGNKHTLKLIVMDKLDNKNIYKSVFYRK